MSRASPASVASLSALLLILVASSSCAPASQSSQPVPRRPALVTSRPMGLVGLLVMNGGSGPPRAAGMHGTIKGYVVSHPSLGSGLTVRSSDRELPVLAFRYNFKFERANGRAGLEEFRGRGTLVISYKADGFTNEVISGAGSIRGGEEVERDDVNFRGRLDFDTYLIHMDLRETAVATRAFTFRGIKLRTRVDRTSYDVLEGEFNDGFFGVAIASTSTMPWMSAPQKLLALSGSPPPAGPFTY